MKYGLIGEKLGHSFSAAIHASLGMYAYELCPIPREELDVWMRTHPFEGINVTIPYKKDVMRYLDGLSAEARACGAVNTVVRRDGLLYGDNTDYFGLSALMDHAGIDPAGKHVLILGTGGTAGTASALCRARGAKSVRTVSRTGAGGALTYAEARACPETEVLINTTPCGMFPAIGEQPITLDAFPRLAGVLDVIYNPLRTRLVLEGASRGIPSEGGLYMLVAQALKSAERFTGKQGLTARCDAIFSDLRKEKENLVLIGMPGCGKTTIGRRLAARTGRDFADSDEVIAARFGAIPTIFEAAGEAGFRDRESAVLSELSARQGLVLATGGGAILKKENVTALRSNGRLYFLDAPIEELAGTPDRPLSPDRASLERLYRERYELYQSVCDKRVEIGRDETKNVEKLLGELR